MPAPSGQVEIRIEALRSAHGLVSVCLTRMPDSFPGCTGGTDMHRISRSAGDPEAIRILDLPVGNYAVAVLHDENGNGRLDKRLGIPREGIGFSGNAPLRMGPPSFASAQFPVAADHVVIQRVRMRYFL